jgi:DeoR family fructose operon transcriptional repressor
MTEILKIGCFCHMGRNNLNHDMIFLLTANNRNNVEQTMKNDETVFVEERREQIALYVNDVKKATVLELSQHFNVSSSTIRNDLFAIEKLNLIRRTHGGALALNNSKVGLEPLPSLNQNKMLAEKKSIAIKASSFIEDGDVIAISTGTTTFELAKTLQTKKDLTIVVNDIQIAYYLDFNTNHLIYLIGGMIRKNFHYSFFSDDNFPTINIDKTFFTCNSLDMKAGSTIPDVNLASNLQKILSRSTSSYLLCDSSKFGKVSFAQVLPISKIDKIIVDDGIGQKTIAAFKSRGLKNFVIADKI